MFANCSIQQNFSRINNSHSKLFNLPLNKINNQSRNKNKYIQERIMNKNSLHSTKEATPRQEYNNSVIHKNTIYTPYKEKNNKTNFLDDSLSNLSEIFEKKNLNYSGIKDKIPGINEEPNFIYDKIIKERSSINRAKILSQKLGVLKLPTSKFSSKVLSNSDRDKNCFSDRLSNLIKIEGYSNYKEINDNKNEDMGLLCWCFGK